MTEKVIITNWLEPFMDEFNNDEFVVNNHHEYFYKGKRLRGAHTIMTPLSPYKDIYSREHQEVSNFANLQIQDAYKRGSGVEKVVDWLESFPGTEPTDVMCANVMNDTEIQELHTLYKPYIDSFLNVREQIKYKTLAGQVTVPHKTLPILAKIDYLIELDKDYGPFKKGDWGIVDLKTSTTSYDIYTMIQTNLYKKVLESWGVNIKFIGSINVKKTNNIVEKSNIKLYEPMPWLDDITQSLIDIFVMRDAVAKQTDLPFAKPAILIEFQKGGDE